MNKNEGELKQRIREMTGYPEAFEQLVDEAKQEAWFYFYAFNEDMKKEAREELQKLISKWFGEAEK